MWEYACSCVVIHLRVRMFVRAEGAGRDSATPVTMANIFTGNLLILFPFPFASNYISFLYIWTCSTILQCINPIIKIRFNIETFSVNIYSYNSDLSCFM